MKRVETLERFKRPGVQIAPLRLEKSSKSFRFGAFSFGFFKDNENPQRINAGEEFCKLDLFLL